jgi:hypothetical protein
MRIPAALFIGDWITNCGDHVGPADNSIGNLCVDFVLESNAAPIETQVRKIKPRVSKVHDVRNLGVAGNSLSRYVCTLGWRRGKDYVKAMLRMESLPNSRCISCPTNMDIGDHETPR